MKLNILIKSKLYFVMMAAMLPTFSTQAQDLTRRVSPEVSQKYKAYFQGQNRPPFTWETELQNTKFQEMALEHYGSMLPRECLARLNNKHLDVTVLLEGEVHSCPISQVTTEIRKKEALTRKHYFMVEGESSGLLESKFLYGLENRYVYAVSDSLELWIKAQEILKDPKYVGKLLVDLDQKEKNETASPLTLSLVFMKRLVATLTESQRMNFLNYLDQISKESRMNITQTWILFINTKSPVNDYASKVYARDQALLVDEFLPWYFGSVLPDVLKIEGYEVPKYFSNYKNKKQNFVRDIDLLNELIMVSLRNVVFAKNILDQICRVQIFSEKEPLLTPKQIIARMGMAHVRGVEYLLLKSLKKSKQNSVKIETNQVFLNYADLSDSEFEQTLKDLNAFLVE